MVVTLLIILSIFLLAWFWNPAIPPVRIVVFIILAIALILLLLPIRGYIP